MQIKYRPEIDGLRAIAVLSVIFYHAQIVILGFQPFKSGFIGVDIFFVISGYLITSIILKEIFETKNFSFKNFYKRRIKRILPALFFVILLSLPFAWVYLYPIDLVNFSESILYTLGFSSNFYFHYSNLEYGSPESILKPYLHTWSLSVEEQFYILFPPFLLLIFKYFRKYIFSIFLIIFITSLLFSEWGSRNYPSSNFYFIHSRIWELIVGSMFAYLEIKFGHRSTNQILNSILPKFGLLLIFYAIIYFDDQVFHPSFYTLIPIIGVSLIIWFADKDEIISRVLSSKIFVGIGLISYSLYLWHYVIFSFAKNLDIYFDDLSGKCFLIVLAIILSVFTFFLIERPARKTNNFRFVSYTLLVSILIIITFSISVILKEGFLNRVKVKNFQNKHTYIYLTQDDKPCFGRQDLSCKFGSKERKIILIGDSQIGSLTYDLYDRVKSDYSFLPIVNPGYFHLKNSHLLNKHTKKINSGYNVLRNKIDKILNESRNNIIILGGATSLYFYNKRIQGRALHWDYYFINKDTLKRDPKFVENDFLNLVRELSTNNEIILLYPIPEIGTNLQKKKFINKIRVFNYYYSDFIEQNKEVIDFFNTINSSKVHKVYPYKIFCNEDTNLCKTHDSDNFFFFDGYHPSLEGAKMINSLIISEIDKINNKNK